MEFFGNWGYLGLFIGCFLAATVVPFSSDALFISALTISSSIPLTLLWGVSGNWLGGLVTYWMGHIGKWEWIEKYFRIKPATLEKQKKKVNKYGSWLALLTWVPIIGDVFALALGFYRINFYSSALFMFIGKLARFVLLIIIFLYFKDKLDWFILPS
jgi:membrane protein YqaA with SNARE-associated domain